MTTGILLAAGSSTRFGSNKLQHPLEDGTPIAVAAARNLVAALPDTIAVVRPGRLRLAAMLRDAGCRVVTCRNAAEGMGASLARAARAAKDASGWVVALADMPYIRPATIRVIADALAEGAAIAAPAFQGQRGHPVGLARRFGDELMALRGDQGARHIIGSRPDWVTLYEVDDPGVLRDIDIPADLRAGVNPGRNVG